jgi:hypothetical protein
MNQPAFVLKYYPERYFSSAARIAGVIKARCFPWVRNAQM